MSQPEKKGSLSYIFARECKWHYFPVSNTKEEKPEFKLEQGEFRLAKKTH